MWKRLLTFVLLLLCAQCVCGRDLPEIGGEARLPHPRLLCSAGEESEVKIGITEQPVLRGLADFVIESADEMTDIKPVERKKLGRRLLGVSRTCLKRVMFLAMAYRLTGKDRYAERAEEEMLAAARFRDWNPSHFLDVAEMTAALGIGYDWLYDALAPDARREIRDAIINKGLRPSLNGGWWVNTNNNWNQVCHSGLILGALAVMEHEPVLAQKVVHRAVEKIPIAADQYEPDGAYPEGPGYWRYGTTYQVLAISALKSVFGETFGLDRSCFLESSDYYTHAIGPSGRYFNYSDCGNSAGVAPAMFWFASQRGRPDILWREVDALEAVIERGRDVHGGSRRFLPLILMWARNLDDVKFPKKLGWVGSGESPVAMFRTGWEDPDAIYLGVKAGTPQANHAHMDIGSFVMEADGVRWAIDLGSQSYHSLESRGISLWGASQDSERWDVFRLNNFSHNTLVVDGAKQRVSGFAPIVRSSNKENWRCAVVDMDSVYEGELSKARRGVGISDGSFVVVQDEIRAPQGGASVRWGMVTRAQVTIENDRLATLRHEGESLRLKVVEPSNAELEIYSTAKPPNEYDAPNKGTRMIGFKSQIPAEETSRFVVLLIPDTHSVSYEEKPLSRW